MQSGITPLMAAAENGHAHVVQALLRVVAAPHVDVREKTEGYTALHLACREGHRECVRALIQAGAKVNVKSKVSEWMGGLRVGGCCILTNTNPHGA